jgi:sulfite exporter TauE/SafE
MKAYLLLAFTTGLTAGLGCLAACAPVFIAVGATGAASTRRRGVFALVQLLLGRLAGYVAFGLALGAVGEFLLPKGTNLVPIFGAAGIILSLFLVAHGLGIFSGKSRLCAAMGFFSRGARLPFFIGLLTGLSLCWPFLTAAAIALRTQSIVGSALVFLAFFIGTSLYMIPFFAMPFAAGTKISAALKRVGQFASFAAAICFFISGIAAFAPLPKQWEPPYPTEADLALAEREAESFEFQKAPRRKWLAAAQAKTERGEVVRREISTVYYTQDTFAEGKAPKGYAGPVPVIVSLDNAGRIRGLPIYENLETGSYISRLTPEYIRKFIGKPYTDAFRIGSDVDAVTGATRTLDALTASLRETVRDAAERDLALPPPPVEAAAHRSQRTKTSLIVALFIAATVIYLMRLRRLRYALLAASAGILGFWMQTHLDLASLTNAMNERFDSPAADSPFLIMLILAVILTVAFGRFYCGFICPFGALSELIGKIPTPKIALSRREDEIFRPAKYLALLSLIAIYLSTRNANVFFFEPFTITFTAPAQLPLLWRDAAMPVVFAALMLCANLFVPRFFCRYLCPTGALFAVLSLLRIRFTARDEAECRGCFNQGFARPHECFNCPPTAVEREADAP